MSPRPRKKEKPDIGPYSVHLQVVITDPVPLAALAKAVPGFGHLHFLWVLVHKLFIPAAHALGVRIVIVNVKSGPLPPEVYP